MRVVRVATLGLLLQTYWDSPSLVESRSKKIGIGTCLLCMRYRALVRVVHTASDHYVALDPGFAGLVSWSRIFWGFHAWISAYFGKFLRTMTESVFLNACFGFSFNCVSCFGRLLDLKIGVVAPREPAWWLATGSRLHGDIP